MRIMGISTIACFSDADWAELRIEDPHQVIVSLLEAIWFRGRTRSKVLCHDQVQKWNIGLWLKEFMKRNSGAKCCVSQARARSKVLLSSELKYLRMQIGQDHQMMAINHWLLHNCRRKFINTEK